MRLSTPLLSGILCAAPLLLAPDPAGAQDGTWALTNARIETVTNGTIERGTIVIRDGLITAVGANVTPPSDARVVDLAGHTIYPGIINLTSSLGVPAAPTPTGGGRGGGGPDADSDDSQPLELSPGREIARELEPSDGDLRAAREAGITTVLVAPTRGAFRGLSALLPTRADSATSYIVKAPVGVHMGFEGVRGRYPGNLLGVMAYERQSFYDARRHGLMMDAWRADPTSRARPMHSADLDALVPVVRGDRPVFFEANDENEILRALSIAEEFDLDLHIVGATEAFLTIDELQDASAPVVVVDFPDADDVTGWSYRGAQRRALDDSATRTDAVEKLVESNAAALHRNGIEFALATGSVGPGDFLDNVRKTVAAGLPASVAIAALTIRPAEIAGVERTLGSIETGKIADLVVTTGPLLDDSTHITSVFVDGIRHDVPPPSRTASRGAGGGEAGAVTPASLAGTWNMITESPQGAVDGTLTFTASGNSVGGTMAIPSMDAQGTVTDSRIEGSTVTFTVSISIGGQAIDVVYNGTVNGDRMSGSATAGEFGTMTFTAEKQP